MQSTSHEVTDTNTFPCPACGAPNWSLKKSIEHRNGRTTVKPNERPVFKVRKGNHEEEIKENINRRFHPYKHLSTFGIVEAEQNPVINPPVNKANPHDPSIKTVISSSNKMTKALYLISQMSGEIYSKYPYREVIKLYKNMTPGILALGKEMLSGTDSRYQRSLREWIEICKYAEENSAREASRKFYGIKSNGDKVPLSSRYIAKKIKEVKNFQDNYLAFEPLLFYNANLLGRVIATTPELAQRFKQLSKEYDKQERIKKNGEKNPPNYTYIYHKIIHYAKDGRKECGRFKKSDLARAIKIAIGIKSEPPSNSRVSKWPVKDWMENISILSNTMLDLLYEISSDILDEMEAKRNVSTHYNR